MSAISGSVEASGEPVSAAPVTGMSTETLGSTVARGAAVARRAAPDPLTAVVAVATGCVGAAVGAGGCVGAAVAAGA
jgi:hypothetical protein